MVKVNIAEIKNIISAEVAFKYELTAADLDLTDEVEFVGPVQVEGTVSNTGDVLFVQAQLQITVARTCARCLQEFTAPSTIQVEEKFYPAGAENLELGACTYAEDQLDLTETLRDGILLAEPMNPLCSEACKGICPKCGVNRNETACDCDTYSIDPRLLAFKSIKLD